MANVEEDNKEENNKHEPAGETGEDELAGELEFGSDNEKEEEAVDVNGKGPSAEEEVVVDRKNVRGEEGRSRESTPKRSARGERQEESPRPIPVSPKRSARDSTREGTPKRSARGDEQENRGSRDGTPKRSARGEEEEQKEGSPREKVASRHSSRGSARSKKEEHSDDERSSHSDGENNKHSEVEDTKYSDREDEGPSDGEDGKHSDEEDEKGSDGEVNKHTDNEKYENDKFDDDLSLGDDSDSAEEEEEEEKKKSKSNKVHSVPNSANKKIQKGKINNNSINNLNKKKGPRSTSSSSTQPEYVPPPKHFTVGSGSGLPHSRGRQAHDMLVVKDKEIAALKQEIKTLQAVHRRQSKAIMVMDEQQHFLPATVNGLQDENRGMRDQIKSLKEKLGNEERAAKALHEQLHKYKQRCTNLLELVKAKGLSEDDEKNREKEKEELEKTKEKLKDLTHQVALLTKVREQEDKKMRAKLKEAYAESDNLRSQLTEADQKRKRNVSPLKQNTSPTIPRVVPAPITIAPAPSKSPILARKAAPAVSSSSQTLSPTMSVPSTSAAPARSVSPSPVRSASPTPPPAAPAELAPAHAKPSGISKSASQTKKSAVQIEKVAVPKVEAKKKEEEDIIEEAVIPQENKVVEAPDEAALQHANEMVVQENASNHTESPKHEILTTMESSAKIQISPKSEIASKPDLTIDTSSSPPVPNHPITTPIIAISKKPVVETPAASTFFKPNLGMGGSRKPDWKAKLSTAS